MAYDPEEFLTAAEVALRIRKTPRFVRMHYTELNGQKIGRNYFFRWGSVLEVWNNAVEETRPEQPVDGSDNNKQQGHRVQNVPSRKEKRTGVAGGQGVGGKEKTGTTSIDPTDPFGLLSIR